MRIIKTIKIIRELRNYSQEYMAERIGISQVSYSRIETGQTKLDVTRLQVIADILDVTVSFLVTFNEEIIFKFCKDCDKIALGI
jgi:transcriptional regulator with XRE-family HTH domain